VSADHQPPDHAMSHVPVPGREHGARGCLGHEFDGFAIVEDVSAAVPEEVEVQDDAVIGEVANGGDQFLGRDVREFREAHPVFVLRHDFAQPVDVGQARFRGVVDGVDAPRLRQQAQGDVQGSLYVEILDDTGGVAAGAQRVDGRVVDAAEDDGRARKELSAQGQDKGQGVVVGGDDHVEALIAVFGAEERFRRGEEVFGEEAFGVQIFHRDFSLRCIYRKHGVQACPDVVGPAVALMVGVDDEDTWCKGFGPDRRGKGEEHHEEGKNAPGKVQEGAFGCGGHEASVDKVFAAVHRKQKKMWCQGGREFRRGP